jgi:Peptidase propeptide and YPEB domain
MNTKTTILALMLGAALSGSVLAQSGTLSKDDVRAQLIAQGYTDISDLEFKDGTWTADAKSADGNHQNVRIDTKTGKAYPEDLASGLTEDQVKEKLAAAGYTHLHDFSFSDGVWSGKGDDPTGKEVEVKADPTDGHVIGAEDD